MSTTFSPAEWATINARLDRDPAAYGLPRNRDGSVVLLSWNIRKFGAVADSDGPKKTPGAFDMIERVCAEADLVAIQEVMTDTASLYELHRRLESRGAAWGIVMSDVTGRVPGRRGAPERMAFLYRRAKVRPGDLASDLNIDRTAVIDNTNEALAEVVRRTREKEGEEGLWAAITAFITGQGKIVGARLRRFVQFIRAPHLVEFIIEGPGGRYELYCINAHLVSGQSKTERELEFFALLEWMLFDSPNTVVRDGKIYMLMADLNLDFESNVDKRRAAFADYITSLNAEKDLRAKVNFPFLDGGFFTNSRRDQTFDHIAWVAHDDRLPRGRHNDLAGSLGPDQYDYGMFDFVQLFSDAGPGAGRDGPDYARYEHDLSDHMPIWVRLPLPSDDQHDFSVPQD